MIEFFVRRRIATCMMFVAVLILGGISLARLKVSLFPDIVFPKLLVLTPYQSVGPEEIENLVTRPIEDGITAVNGVRNVSSRSQEGLSIVEVTLEWGASLDLATINIRQKVDLARSILPEDTGKSMIVKFDPSTDPVVTVVARPVGVEFENLRDYVDKNVRPFMERIPGVASLSILGGYKREIQVNVDRAKLVGYNLTLDQVVQAIASSNFNFPAGNVKKGDREYTVRIMGEFSAVPEIGETVIATSKEGVPVYLRQVAQVLDGKRERKGSTYYNGEQAIIIGIKKEPDRNTIETADAIHRGLVEINSKFGKSVRFDVVRDRSQYVRSAIGGVAQDALLGCVIAFVILFMFLRDIRASSIIVITLPFAVISTFILMYIKGISLNIMSLGGLSIGTGLMLDNSIVVLEAIYMEMENHPERTSFENAVAGTRTVLASVNASTITSSVVFVPIIFVSGVAGEVFRDLALTVTFSNISSYVCSLTLIPMLATLDPEGKSKVAGWMRRANAKAKPAFAGADRMLTFLRSCYQTGIRYSLENPGRTILFAGGISLLGALMVIPVERRLFPTIDSGDVQATLELPGGTSLAEAETFHLHVQDFLGKNKQSIHAITNMGFDEDDLASRVKGVRKGNYAESEFFVNPDNVSSKQFIENLKKGLSGLGGIEASYRIKGDALQELLGESGSKLIFEIEAVDRKAARELALFAYERVRTSDLTRSVHSTALARDPETRVHLDRAKTASFGITPEAIAGVISTALRGNVSTVYREGDREIDVRVRLRENDRARTDQLHNLYVQTGGGQNIELGRLIQTTDGLGFTTIWRQNQRRVERVEVEFADGRKQEMQRLLFSIRDELPKSFPEMFALETAPDVRVHEENEETLDSLKNLLYAFLLSTALIYMLLAGQFESLVHPLTLALSIPMMMFGVSGALLVSGHSLNITSAIGIVMLTGIVVNNAVVLFEYITLKREEGEVGATIGDLDKLPAVIEASGLARLRPILLTTLCTILGLMPFVLGIGDGAAMQAPMAVVVIGGLSVSTILTLVAFPTMYYLVERARALGVKKVFNEVRGA
ncbi:MAG: efflux RND transporter permease subunit [Leptospirales bacterium]|nr:efflux RND transporter permease subunit [Leptospirales bacterium]